ncbi:MAG TPA: IPT/TIG domain-containing protein [Candidatus Sulfotelmatobacter sp.]|nr:IPT/TIG domain-containing protein [Candidatus Sulfotelmatobacter sp.]
MATTARSPVLVVLVVAAVVALSCGTCPPVPSITSISPASATAGGSQFLLTVNGSEFRRDATVKWNGASRVTTFVSAHQLSAAITAADIAQPGTVLISVFDHPEGSITSVSGAIGAKSTSACSGKNSNAVSFTVSP